METVPLHFAVFESSVCLRFFFGGFFRTNFGMGVRGFWGGVLGPKMPFLRPENGEKKRSSPFLRFFSEFYFCYGTFLRRVLGNELRDLYWWCFCMVLGARFFMDLLI